MMSSDCFSHLSSEKEVVLEMVRAISDSNLQFREQMDELRRVKEPEYESNILYHESSLDPFCKYFLATK